jgi:hypothetical protein
VNATLKTILLGLGGLALAVLLSLGAFALAGRSLSEPSTSVPAPSRAADGGRAPSDDPSPSSTPTHRGSATPSTRPTETPSPDDHGGSSDDHSGPGGGGGSDDPPGDDHDGDDD